MDDETPKLAMLIAAFGDEEARLHGNVEKVTRSAVLLKHEIRNAAREAVEAALKAVHPHVDKAEQTLVDLQRLSLWRPAFHHGIVAVVAIAITLLTIWWHVPPRDETALLRSERDQSQISIDDLKQRGALIATLECRPQNGSAYRCTKPTDQWAPTR